jgi:hypothetical protein
MATEIASTTGSGAGARVRTVRLAVVAGAVLAALLTWVIIEPVIGHDLYAPSLNGAAPEDIGVVETLYVALIPSLVAWAFLAVLERFVPRLATVIWAVVAVVVLLVTMPWSGDYHSGGDQASLIALHLVVAAVLIPGLVWSSARRTRAARAS